MIEDMPKLESPFERDASDHGQHYYCVPTIRDEYRWVFTPDCLATDKLDGTNVSILVQDGQIRRIFNRTNEVHLFTKGSLRFYEGIVRARERKYFIPGLDQQAFGELIGPGIRGNPYQLKECRWVPFDRLKGKFHFKFWPKFMEELQGKSDEEIYEQVSAVFKELWSIYKLHLGFDKTPVNEGVGFSGVAAEGIVFYSKAGRMAKLRRDMFDWFKGGKHKRKQP